MTTHAGSVAQVKEAPVQRRIPVALVVALAVLALVLLVLTRNAFAEEPSPADALLGPDVATDDASLVERDYDGRIKRLTLQPAEAAVLAMDLDERTMALVREALDVRNQALDTIVAENLRLLTQVETAAENGEMLTLVKIGWKLHKQFVDEYGQDSLENHLAELLTDEQADQLRTTVDQYWTAVVADEVGEAANRVERFMTRRGIAIELFGEEIGRAFERISMDDGDDDDEAFERLLAQLDPTSEQEATIRTLAEEFYFDTKANPTKQDEVELIMEIYDVLDDERQRRLVELLVSMEE